jgi:hypothetical protein
VQKTKTIKNIVAIASVKKTKHSRNIGVIASVKRKTI